MNSSSVNIREPRAHSVDLTDEALSVDLVDGRTVIVPLVWFPRLWYGSPEERKIFELVGDGAYIHWPILDEDLTVVGLLDGKRSGESSTSLKRWLESRKPSGGKQDAAVGSNASFILPAPGNSITSQDIKRGYLRITSDLKKYFPETSAIVTILISQIKFNIRFEHRGKRSHLLKVGRDFIRALDLTAGGKVKIEVLEMNKYRMSRVP